MKRLIYLLILLATFSCNFKERKLKKEQELQKKQIELKEKAFIDSITNVRQDSIRIVELDSLNTKKGLVAWGGANFGMSVNQVSSLNSFKGYYDSKNSLYPVLDGLILFSSKTGIKDINQIDAKFYNDRLYEIFMESSYYSANYYDNRLYEIATFLKSMLEEKYGSPTKDYGYPQFFSLKPDNSITAYFWEVGYKKVYISVEEKYDGYTYRVTCLIRNEKEYTPAQNYIKEINKKIEGQKNNQF